MGNPPQTVSIPDFWFPGGGTIHQFKNEDGNNVEEEKNSIGCCMVDKNILFV